MKTLIKNFFICLIILISCNRSPEKLEWKDFKLEDDKISIKYPENWSLDISKKFGANVFLFSGNTENINLIIQDIGNEYDIDSYTQLSENQIRSIDGAILYQSKKTKLNGDDAQYIEYQANFKKRRELRFIQYYILKNKKAYVITFTCELNRFDKSKDLALKIMENIKIQ
jgi:hypothetical protein